MNAFMPEQLNLKRAKKDDKKQLRKLAFLKRSKGKTLLHEIPGPRPGALWGESSQNSSALGGCRLDLTRQGQWGRTWVFMSKKFIIALVACLVLTQCHSLRSDCEKLREREAAIAQEVRGEYFVGRRYYIPLCRFWGYLREPGQSWREAKLVMMDESVVHTPDRGPEEPLPGAVFGKDQNVEYIVRGKYTGRKAYDPSTDQVLPVFRATSYAVRNNEPGFLFVPSEEYSEDFVSLRPAIMPRPEACERELAKP